MKARLPSPHKGKPQGWSVEGVLANRHGIKYVLSARRRYNYTQAGHMARFAMLTRLFRPDWG